MSDLVSEVKALGPWHLEVEVVPGMTTRVEVLASKVPGLLDGGA